MTGNHLTRVKLSEPATSLELLPDGKAIVTSPPEGRSRRGCVWLVDAGARTPSP